jgi:putative tricarboxylic transport membrane protein
MLRRIALIAVLGIWAVLMPKAGFFVTSAIAFLILTGLATFERLDSKTTILYGATAMVFVGVFYFIMVNILGLRMPVSWLL